MKVSIVTPTWNREHSLPRLYEQFRKQTHSDCELIVLDDSPNPSLFFSTLTDPRVRYEYSNQRLTVGKKRNLLAEMASGEVIMHFDDDDYYAANYVEAMLQHLGDADFVKLSAWYMFSQTHNVFAYWDMHMTAQYHYRVESGKPLALFRTQDLQAAERASWSERNLNGWGFSYVYRRKTWQENPFADLRHGEDGAFLNRLLSTGYSIRQVPDTYGIALVIRHGRDHSVTFPQYMLPLHLLPQIFADDVGSFLFSA